MSECITTGQKSYMYYFLQHSTPQCMVHYNRIVIGKKGTTATCLLPQYTRVGGLLILTLNLNIMLWNSVDVCRMPINLTIRSDKEAQKNWPQAPQLQGVHINKNISIRLNLLSKFLHLNFKLHLYLYKPPPNLVHIQIIIQLFRHLIVSANKPAAPFLNSDTFNLFTD